MVPDSRAGKSVRCPKCEAEVQVPERMHPAEAPPVVVGSTLPSAPTSMPSTEATPPPLSVSELQTQPPPIVVGSSELTQVAEVAKNSSDIPPIAPPVIESPPVVALPEAMSGKASPEVAVVPASALVTEEAFTPAAPKGVVASTQGTPSATVQQSLPGTAQSPASAPISSSPSASWMTRIADWGSSMPAAIEIEISTRQWGGQLAVGLLVAALFSCGPSAIDLVDYWRNPEEQFVARWALLLLALGLLQAAFALYVWQLADWTSLWVLTIVSLAVASGFAMMLGVILVAGQESQLMTALQLQDRLIGNKAQLWCLCMIAVYTVLAFFAGRACTFWHRREQLLEALR